MYYIVVLTLFLNFNMTIGQYMTNSIYDKEFKNVHPPFKKYYPIGFWKILVPYRDKNRSIVNVLFWTHIACLIIVLLFDLGLLVLFLLNLFKERVLIPYVFISTAVGLLIGSGIPKWCTIINNGPLRRKYEKANPIQARKHHIQSSQTSKDYCIAVNRKLEKRALDLEKALRKYCYTKEKGIFYILEKDLDRIRTVELKKYKYACEKTEYDEKGQQYFVIFDEYHKREIFRASIK